MKGGSIFRREKLGSCRRPDPPPLFHPTKRAALLVNGWDNWKGYSQGNFSCRGNKRIYEMEVLLSGTVAQIDHPDMTAKLWATLVRLGVQDLIFEAHRNRREIRYEINRVLPPQEMKRSARQKSMKEQITDALEKRAGTSKEDDLTFVYITSHGERGIIGMGRNEEYEHAELLERLEGVKGKKVLLLLACHSGSFIDLVDRGRNRENYAVITSTASDEEGRAWREDELDGLIYDVIARKERLSGPTLARLELLFEPETHHPQVYLPFDVIL
ncbi:caspase family protein [Candidatus Micrarchaeota archaeon]|nr:caspase family protein [Candidatus Micrarchaeota archaeon]